MNEKLTPILADYFFAISHPLRLKILALLKEKGSLCVCEIVEILEKEQSGVSRHLQTLKSAEILEHKIEGVKSIYSIKNRDVFKIIELAKNIVYQNIKEEKERLLSTFK